MKRWLEVGLQMVCNEASVCIVMLPQDIFCDELEGVVWITACVSNSNLACPCVL